MKGALLILLLGAAMLAVVVSASSVELVQDKDSDCKKEFKKKCGDELDKLEKDVDDADVVGIIKSTVKLVRCVIENAEDIVKKCLPKEGEVLPIDSADMLFIMGALPKAVQKEQAAPVVKAPGDCQDVVNKYCGSQMKNLESLLASGASPQDIVKGARDLISCLIEHDDEIGPICNGGINTNAIAAKTQGADLETPRDCIRMLYQLCGRFIKKLDMSILRNDVLGIVLGSIETAVCLVTHQRDLGTVCEQNDPDADRKMVAAAIAAEREEMLSLFKNSGDDESKCHKELYKECGDELKELKKAIEDISPTGIAGASMRVAGCVTVNIMNLIEACNPFQQMMENEIGSTAEEEEIAINGMDERAKNFVDEVKKSHFDFQQCVEAAKHMIIHSVIERHHHGDDDHHHHDDHHHEPKDDGDMMEEDGFDAKPIWAHHWDHQSWDQHWDHHPSHHHPVVHGLVMLAFLALSFFAGYRTAKRRLEKAAQVAAEAHKEGYVPMVAESA